MTSSNAVRTPFVSFTLRSSVIVTHIFMGYSTENSAKSGKKETKGVTNVADDVKNPTLQSAIPRILFNVESCYLNRFYYF